MSNVLPFQRVVQGARIDDIAVQIAFANDRQVAAGLQESFAWGDPTAYSRVVVAVARALLMMTERDARAIGFADRQTAHERGLRLLDLVVSEFCPK